MRSPSPASSINRFKNTTPTSADRLPLAGTASLGPLLSNFGIATVGGGRATGSSNDITGLQDLHRDGERTAVALGLRQPELRGKPRAPRMAVAERSAHTTATIDLKRRRGGCLPTRAKPPRSRWSRRRLDHQSSPPALIQHRLPPAHDTARLFDRRHRRWRHVRLPPLYSSNRLHRPGRKPDPRPSARSSTAPCRPSEGTHQRSSTTGFAPSTSGSRTYSGDNNNNGPVSSGCATPSP